MSKTKTVYVLSSETVLYRTAVEVSVDATQEDIEREFYRVTEDGTELEAIDATGWHITEIIPEEQW